MNINEQIDQAAGQLAIMTQELGFRHPDRLAVLKTCRALQAERKRRMEAEGFTSVFDFIEHRKQEEVCWCETAMRGQ